MADTKYQEIVIKIKHPKEAYKHITCQDCGKSRDMEWKCRKCKTIIKVEVI